MMATFNVSMRGSSAQTAPLQLLRRFHLLTLRIFIACVLVPTCATPFLYATPTNAIQQENSLAGTPGWDDFSAASAQDALSGFGSTISVNAGGSIDFYVTTTAASFNIDIFRTGYYQGIGARRVESLGSFPGLHQAIPPPDPVTGIVACTSWAKTTTLQVPSTWVSGVYLAKLTAPGGDSSFIFFVVRDDGGHEDILFQTSVTTYQAYNLWGGTSLYDNQTNKTVYPYAHATKVSFDRPFTPLDSNGAGHYLLYEEYFVYWLEQQGYDVAYTTNVDTDTSTSPLTNHKAFLSVGHDEYWSRGMRINVENAIASGVNFGFFSANSLYWQIRFEPNSNGVPNRVQVGYKDFAASPTPPGPDPQFQVNNSILTANWRDPLINEPENAVIGIMFESAASGNYIVQNSTDWVYNNTGLVDGTSVPNIVGYEYDKVWNNGFSPAGLTVLSQSPVVDGSGLHSNANSTIYIAPSGANVFASGTIQWSWGLANLQSRISANAGIQRTTANILNNFILGVSEATLNPTAVDFSGALVGTTTAPQTISLTNTGTGNLNLTSISLTGANPGDFAQTNNCPATLATSQSCIVNATFTPVAVGTRSATLALTDNATNSPQGVSLTGTGQATVAPIVSLNPTTLTFGSQNVGTSSTPQMVTLSNIGTAPLSIGSIAMAGTNPGDFSSTNTCPTGTNSLPVNTSCAITVTYSPLAGGTRSAIVTVIDNAADSPESVAVTGSAIVPTIYFKDGLESGNFSLWNLTSGDSTGQRTVETQVVNNGTHAASFTNGTGQYSYIYTALAAPQLQTFTRFYFRLASLPKSTPLAVGANSTGASREIDYDSSFQGLDFYFWDRSGTVYSLFSAQSSIAANTWYCVEIGDTQTTTGQGQAWLNGALLGIVNADLSNTKPFGQFMLYTSVAGTFYFDDVVVSNLYNGPLNPGPSANLNPSTVVFGSQVVNTASNSQTVTLSNQGTAPLSIGRIALGGTNPGDFAQTNQCPIGSNTLAVNASCTISITFTPTATGTRSAMLVISDNDPTSTQNVPVSGTGANPSATVTFSPTSLTYSSQVVGTTSAGKSIVVTSTGSAALSISSIAIGGTNPGDFAQTNNCPTGSNTLAVNASCTISITFTPAATGTRSATLLISDSDPTGTQNVPLSGSGSTPASGITLSPTTLTYSSQLVGTSSAGQTITLSSTGSAALAISSIALSGTSPGDFAQTNNCPMGSNTLAPNASCTISVTFTPTATGTRKATLTVSSSGPATALSVALSGTGMGPVASLSSTSLTWTTVRLTTTSAAKNVTLSNKGNATLNITSIAVTGDFGETNTCSSTLAAGTSCTISVTFSPTTTGTRTGALLVSDDSTNGSPQSASLSGTGVDFAMSVSPASATVTAGSIASYTVTVSALGGNFSSSVSLSCSGLPKGAKCSFSTTPLSPGTGSASSGLNISTTAGSTGTPGGTYTITINGSSGTLKHSAPVGLQVN